MEAARLDPPAEFFRGGGYQSVHLWIPSRRPNGFRRISGGAARERLQDRRAERELPQPAGDSRVRGSCAGGARRRGASRVGGPARKCVRRWSGRRTTGGNGRASRGGRG